MVVPCLYVYRVCCALCTRPKASTFFTVLYIQYNKSTHPASTRSTTKIRLPSPARSSCPSSTQQLELGTFEAASKPAYRLLLLLLLLLQLVTGAIDSRDSVLQPLLLLLLLRVCWCASLAASAACGQQRGWCGQWHGRAGVM
jgi:hypothetical protein